MNIKELIEILREYDQRLEVYRTEGTGIKKVTKIDTYGIISPKYKLVLEII